MKKNYTIIYIIVVTITQQTRGIYLVPEQCRANVYDAGRTLNQHRASVSCLLGVHHYGTQGSHLPLYIMADMTLLYLALVKNSHHDPPTIQETRDQYRGDTVSGQCHPSTTRLFPQCLSHFTARTSVCDLGLW